MKQQSINCTIATAAQLSWSRNGSRLDLGKAQEFLAEGGPVAAGSVSLVLTDPPYLISRETGFKNQGAEAEAKYAGKFNISMDFGTWDHDDGFSMADLAEVVEGLHRVLRPGGAAIVFFDIWKISDLVELMRRAGFEGLTMIQWRKTNAVPINARHTYLSNAREVAVVGYKPGGPVTFRAPDPVKYAGQNAMAHRTGRFYYPIYQGKDRFHPTQKSLALFELLIEMHSEPGDVVLDCFSGSGTTGAAAINTGRRYLGGEADPVYFEGSVARLDAATSLLSTLVTATPAACPTSPVAGVAAPDEMSDREVVDQAVMCADCQRTASQKNGTSTVACAYCCEPASVVTYTRGLKK